MEISVLIRGDRWLETKTMSFGSLNKRIRETRRSTNYGTSWLRFLATGSQLLSQEVSRHRTTKTRRRRRRPRRPRRRCRLVFDARRPTFGYRTVSL